MTQPGNIPESILVSYPKRYAAAFFHLLKIEGGWVDDPVDRGGATKYGISLRFLVTAGQIDRDKDGFADFDLDFDGDIDGQDIRKLTVENAFYLYHEHFWKPLGCDELPRPIGEMVFDQGVNGGNVAAKKLLQRAINYCLSVTSGKAIAVDGVIGSTTILAMTSVLAHPGIGFAGLAEAYRQAVRDRYHAIVASDPSQRRFLKGWLRRADELGRW